MSILEHAGYYRLFDLVLKCSFELPELVPVSETVAEADYEIAFSAAPPPLGTKTRDLELEDGTVWATLLSGSSFYVLHLPPYAAFSLTGCGVACHPSANLPAASLRNLLLNQVLPLVIAHNGHIVLHASSSLYHGRAIAFLGAAGRGKSTLAASFALHGFPAISDDALLLGFHGAQATVVGSYPDLRLWADSISNLFSPTTATRSVAHYSDKRRIGASGTLNFHTERVPLARLYLLHSEADVTQPAVAIESLKPAEAAVEVIRHAYRLDTNDYQRFWLDQQRIAQLVSQDRVRRLRFRRDYARLPAVREAIEEDLETN